MKFRNPETGEVFDSLREASDKFCSDHDCFWRECPLDKANESRACWDWIQEYPIEAARLMGYEVVEDEQFREVTKMMKEANMDKPLKDWTLEEVVNHCNERECGFCELYQHHDCVLRLSPNVWDLSGKPRWTEQEVEDAKTLCRMWPGGEIEFKRYVDGRCTMVHIQGSLHGCLDLGQVDLFPSLRPGETVTIDEIIGGAE